MTSTLLLALFSVPFLFIGIVCMHVGSSFNDNKLEMVGWTMLVFGGSIDFTLFLMGKL